MPSSSPSSVSPFFKFKYYIYALSMLLQMLSLLLLVPPSLMATMHETEHGTCRKKGLRQRPNVVCKTAGWWTLHDWHILLSIFFSSSHSPCSDVRRTSKYCICENCGIYAVNAVVDGGVVIVVIGLYLLAGNHRTLPPAYNSYTWSISSFDIFGLKLLIAAIVPS